MSDPRNEWAASRPPGPPPSSGQYRQPPGPPPAAAPAGAGVPPPPGAPPPSRSRTIPQPRDRGALVAGAVIIVIGVFFLIGQFVPDLGRWIPLLIGLVFLGGFVVRRDYGLLVAGCIISGVGAGVVLEGILDDRWSGSVVLLSIAAGFVAIWVIGALLRQSGGEWARGVDRGAGRAIWWPLIPGGILALIGVVVLAEEGFDSDILRWWPLLLIGAGVIILASALSGRRGRQAP